MKQRFEYGALHCTPPTPLEIEKQEKKKRCQRCLDAIERVKQGISEGPATYDCGRCQLIKQWIKDGKPKIELTIIHPIDLEKD